MQTSISTWMNHHPVRTSSTRIAPVSTARLDRDDTDGFGPENIFVGQGASLPGIYRVYLVHFGRSVGDDFRPSKSPSTPDCRMNGTQFFSRIHI